MNSALLNTFSMTYGVLYGGVKLLGHVVDFLKLYIKMPPVNIPKTSNEK